MQSMLEEISPEYSLKGLMLKLQYFGHLRQRLLHWKRPWWQGHMETPSHQRLVNVKTLKADCTKWAKEDVARWHASEGRWSGSVNTRWFQSREHHRRERRSFHGGKGSINQEDMKSQSVYLQVRQLQNIRMKSDRNARRNKYTIIVGDFNISK